MSEDKLLDVVDLHVSFDTYGGRVHAVRGVNVSVKKGETLAIVGESGCGKSVTAQSIMRLIAEPPGKITNGEVLFKGQDILSFSEKKMRSIRGREISMIFQDPMTSLNPTLTIGDQLTEGLIKHQKLSLKEAGKRALSMLKLVGISNAKERLKQFPHQFSGGMRQRIMIAMALMCDPEILIADEPTTALDVTIQAQILDLFKDIQKKMGVAIIMITHDLGVVAQLADRIQVMYAGRVVEEGNRRDLFYRPQHPYTRGLLHSVPRMDADRNVPLVPIAGTPPDLFSPPIGCAFADRCAYAMEVCALHDPPKTEVASGHRVACWLQDVRAQQAFEAGELPMLKKLV
ncbi:ABC transporter ATP-binding protein [Alkalicoccobacillus murimartini]|uniref:Dipeptide transport system ATP-binding protein n=1 Tax=Alkalicoccobacillus murimartini TaxID=171685 RepID=A0ABT9YL84_9BACI|nr:ABC transporter ATP-binding protein [Alkalicoccobacillus murimartini]MDQ0207794.1 dipeptide transport system ATP-binding protein [Alkalicoccobacillus murimartini]